MIHPEYFTNETVKYIKNPKWNFSPVLSFDFQSAKHISLTSRCNSKMGCIGGHIGFDI